MPTSHLPPPPAPVFILSSPRSGSTLLRAMLAGHPALFCPPELNLLPFRTLGERDTTLGRCSAVTCRDDVCDERDGLQRALMELTRQDAAEAERMVARLSDANLSTSQAYRLLAEHVAPRVVVDKSPLNAGRRAWLQRAEDISPGVRYLHLIRHPVAVIDSLGRNRLDVGRTPTATLVAELMWTAAHGNILSFLDHIHPQRHHLVRYEDVVTTPRAALQRVLAFLGLDMNEAVLNPYGGERMTDGVRAGRPALGDPLFLTHHRIDAHLAESWRSVDLPFGLDAQTAEMANRLGYDVTACGPSGAPLAPSVDPNRS